MSRFTDQQIWMLALAASATAPALGHIAFTSIASHDPFSRHRGLDYLGEWAPRQPRSLLRRLGLSCDAPLGPHLMASMSKGLAGLNDLQLSRCLVGRTHGTSAASVILSCIHEAHTAVHLTDDGHLFAEESPGEWLSLPLRPLEQRAGDIVGIPVSRTTLITLLVLVNARPTFQYSDAAGFRANYASYTGQWYIDWPIGKPATVRVFPHDSHIPAADVYPPLFGVRLDRSIQMMAGVVTRASDPQDFSVAFPSRQPAGLYVLELQVKGYGGTHGSRHIYNMNGGKVYDIDFLDLQPIGPVDKDNLAGIEGVQQVMLTSVDGDTSVHVLIRQKEREILLRALDFLPWSSLSWSIHRGFRDLLVAFAKPAMDKYRLTLATRLRDIPVKHKEKLVSLGWSEEFVEKRMGDMAYSAVLAGRGNSGDLVRVVTALAELDWDGPREGLDETHWWRKIPSSLEVQMKVDQDAVVALTKGFVLEWSNEFDYQIYHQLPPELLFT